MKNIYKFSVENTFEKQEITIESNYAETLSLEQLLGMFRQYLLLLSYSEDQVKRIILLSDYDIEKLELVKEELQIYNWDKIL